jgi:hydrogenase nickel incorporation protein HypA/HybF
MHELSLCQALLSQVETLATQHHAQQIISITVRLGPLGGVVPELLEQAFTLAREGTVAARAHLILETLPIRVHCQSCGADSEARPNNLICGVCGDWHTKLLSGDEMLLTSVELELSD